MSPLNSHEFLGIVSTRLVHRLSNYLSVIVGNLAIHDSPQSTPEERAATVMAIREATVRAGHLLDRFSELTRALPREENFCSVQQLLSLLGDWTAARNWTFEVTSDIASKGSLALAGPWKWIAFALDAITGPSPRSSPGERARKEESDQSPESFHQSESQGTLPPLPLGEGWGEGRREVQSAQVQNALTLSTAIAPTRQIPLRDFTPIAHITLLLTDTGPAIDWQAHRENLENFQLAAAYEILQTLGARPETKSLNANQRQTRISLPLIDVS